MNPVGEWDRDTNNSNNLNSMLVSNLLQTSCAVHFYERPKEYIGYTIAVAPRTCQ
jgi:hypothetical protein